jgi:hypothetical protein
MRKRSTKEIIEATVTGSFNRQKRINQEKRRKALEKVAQQRSADEKKKPSLVDINIRKGEEEIKDKQQKRAARIAAEKRKQDQADKTKRDADFEDKQARVSSKEKFANSIAGGKPKLERITSKDKSVSATGKAAMNLAKSATSIGRKVASIPTRMAARKDKEDLGRAQIQKRQAPTSGTTRQKVAYAARPVTKAVSNAATNIRRKTGRGIEKVGKRIIPEDFIHEAEKGKKEIKKEKIDVMKGTNKIEVNPKSLPEAKKMTKSQIEKRDEIADAISTREMNKRYGDKNVKYAIATKLAMKKKKKKKIDEAKVDKVKSPIYSLPRTQARNERRFGKKGSLEPQGFFGQKPSEAAELSKKRTDEHKARRGVKNESVSGIEVQNVSDGIKFREYEFIDVVKPEPMRSPKNNITWTEARDEYGDPVDGPKISKKEKKKNLTSDDKDEKITRSEETVNEISGELANKAFKAANRKYQYADNNLTRERAYKQQKKFSGYASKKYQKLNKDRGDLNKIYNKPDAVKEAKVPEGLMKLAATVAANNKKRKNALQIQKYIGEETPDAISGKDLKRISALSGKKTRFGDGPEGTAKRKAALEKKRGMKLDDHPQFKTEGKGSNPNKRYIGDPIVTSKKSFTKTGKIGIDYYTDDEKKKSEKEQLKNVKDPKKNISRNKVGQKMEMLKRMTPEQRYARKMRIKQQQKDKK